MKKDTRYRQPSGLEWKIFKKLPLALVASTAIPLLMSLMVRYLPTSRTVDAQAKVEQSVDIFAIAVGLTLWTAVFTVAIGCIVVIVMKGPRYSADSYDLQDRNHPEEDKRRNRRDD